VCQPSSTSGSADLTYAALAYDESPRYDFFRGNNEEISPTIVDDADDLGVMNFYAYTSGSSAAGFGRPYWYPAGTIKLTALQNFDQDSMWSKFVFQNTPSGSITKKDSLWVMEDVVGIPLDAGYYWGDYATTGSWRSVVVNEGIEFQENIAGIWTKKASIGNVSQQVLLTVEGDLSVASNPLKIPNVTGRTLTITKVYIIVNTAPVGAAILVDVNKDGVTIFTNQAHRPTIADGAYDGNTTDIDISSWEDGSYLTMDVDQVGSGTAGSYLTVVIVYH